MALFPEEESRVLACRRFSRRATAQSEQTQTDRGVMRAAGLWLFTYRPTVQPTHTAQNAQQPATRQHLFIRMAPAGCCPLHSTPGTQNSQNGQVAQPISDSEPAEPELMPSSPAQLQWTAAISYCLLALAMCHLDKGEEEWGACPGLGATPCALNSMQFYLYSVNKNTQET